MYSPDVFYLQSTAEDRTKMSGMLEAAALWKPNKKQIFRPDLAWQPVALFYQKREDDTVKHFHKYLVRHTKTGSLLDLFVFISTLIKYDDHFYDIAIQQRRSKRYLFIFYSLC